MEYKVKLSWEVLVEADNKEEVKTEIYKVFDPTLLKLDIKEVEE